MHPLVRKLRLYRNRAVWAMYGACIVVITAIGWVLVPNRYLGWKFIAWSVPVLPRLLGVRVEVTGLDKVPDGRCVFVANHRSIFDNVAMVYALRDVRFAGTKRWFDKFAVGTLLRALGCVPVEQTNTMSGIRKLRADCRRLLTEDGRRGGRGMIIFPEGHRAPTSVMLPFKAGAFVVAIDAQVPVVPVALHGTGDVLPLFYVPDTYPSVVRVEILDPLPTSGLVPPDRHTLADAAHGAIADSLVDAAIQRAS